MTMCGPSHSVTSASRDARVSASRHVTPPCKGVTCDAPIAVTALEAIADASSNERRLRRMSHGVRQQMGLVLHAPDQSRLWGAIYAAPIGGLGCAPGFQRLTARCSSGEFFSPTRGRAREGF